MRVTHRSLLVLGVILTLALAVATAYAIDVQPPWTQPHSPQLSVEATPTEPAPSPVGTMVATPVPSLGPWDRC